MPIAFINMTTAYNDPLVINKPVDTAEGDVMIAMTCVQGAVTGVPAGWALSRYVASGQVRLSVYWKAAGPAEPPSYQFDVTVGADCSGSIQTWRGVNNAVPFNASGIQANASSKNIEAPSITTTLDGCMLIFCGTTASGGTGSFTPPGGMTERIDYNVQRPHTSDSEQLAGAGATGIRTAVYSGSGYTNAGYLGALAPGGGSPYWLRKNRWQRIVNGLQEHTL